MHVTITWANDPISAICDADTIMTINAFLDQHDCLLTQEEHSRLIIGYDVHIDTTHDGETVNATITLD